MAFWGRLVFLLACSLVLFSPFATLAKKKSEPLWSILSEKDAEIVPPVTGGNSPFPVRKKKLDAPVIRQTFQAQERRAETEKAVVADVETQNKAVQAGKVLRRIRDIISRKDAFNPDVSRIVIEAKVASDQGKKVLVGDKWLGIGEKITAPIIITDILYSLVGELELVDVDLARVVEGTIEDQLDTGEPMVLKLKDVHQDFVELEDNNGKVHVISFVSSGW